MYYLFPSRFVSDCSWDLKETINIDSASSCEYIYIYEPAGNWRYGCVLVCTVYLKFPSNREKEEINLIIISLLGFGE